MNIIKIRLGHQIVGSAGLSYVELPRFALAAAQRYVPHIANQKLGCAWALRAKVSAVATLKAKLLTG